MAVVAQCLYETQAVPAAETPLTPSPANTRTILDKFTLTNTTGSAVTATVRIVPSGSTAAGGFAVGIVSVPANQAYTCPEIVGHTLNPGDFISILPSAVGLNVRGSGRLVS